MLWGFAEREQLIFLLNGMPEFNLVSAKLDNVELMEYLRKEVAGYKVEHVCAFGAAPRIPDIEFWPVGHWSGESSPKYETDVLAAADWVTWAGERADQALELFKALEQGREPPRMEIIRNPLRLVPGWAICKPGFVNRQPTRKERRREERRRKKCREKPKPRKGKMQFVAIHPSARLIDRSPVAHHTLAYEVGRAELEGNHLNVTLHPNSDFHLPGKAEVVELEPRLVRKLPDKRFAVVVCDPAKDPFEYVGESAFTPWEELEEGELVKAHPSLREFVAEHGFEWPLEDVQ